MNGTLPPVRRRFEHFDSLRGLAVLAVVAFHVSSMTDHIGRGITGRLVAPLGTVGVSIFFVLSGFLLYRPHVAARRSLGPEPRGTADYLRRRALRILPPYWVALTLLAVFPGIVGVFTSDFWRYYGLLQIYWTDTVGGGLVVAWTLCVEVSFYLLLPFWALAAKRARSERGDVAALAAVVVLSGAVAVATMRHSISYLVGISLAGQAIWFALGMLLAHASVAGAERLRALAADHALALWCVAAAALGGLALLTPGSGFAAWLLAQGEPASIPAALAKLALLLLLCATFVLPAVFGEQRRDLPRRLLAWRPVRWLGTVSYGLFLYHLTVAEWLWVHEDPAHFAASGLGLIDRLGPGATASMFVITLAASLPLAWLSYQLIERHATRR